MSLRSYLRGAGLGIIVTALVLTFSGTGKGSALTDDEIKERAKALGMTEGSEVLTDVFTEAEAPEISEVPDVTGSVITEPTIELEPISDTEPSDVAASEALPSEETPSEAAPAASETASKPEETASKPEETASKPEETASKPEEAPVKPEETPAKQEETPSEPEKASEAASDTAAPSEGTKSRVDQMIEEALAENKEENITSEVTGEEKKKSELLADAAETAEESAASVVGTEAGFTSIHVNSGSTSTAVAKALENAGAVSNAAAFDAFLCMKGYDRHISTGDFRIPAGSSDEDIALILMRRK